MQCSRYQYTFWSPVDSPPSSPCSDVADPYVMKDLQEAAVCHTSDGEAGEESEMESPLAA